jgi:tripartite-type tricarboxylate transporter receptor subunit TctC
MKALRCIIVAIALGIGSAGAHAQSYPAKPIRIIVPAVGGSAVDVNARRVAPKLSEARGQPVLVENRPGATARSARAKWRVHRPTAIRCCTGTSTTR